VLAPGGKGGKVKVPLVDLKGQYDSIKGEIDQAIGRVIQRAEYILGPEVRAFEEEIASYTGVKYAIGVASGTDALHLSLLASGIRPGDEVITTPFTFIATAEAVTNCGATPVFADIEPETCNIDPNKIESKITPKTRAIITVHLYGQPVNMTPVLELARKYNLRVIEDCAQALGVEYQGKRAGALGDAGCLSFFPSKTLGAYGDGGMVVTDNPEIAERVAMLRSHGSRKKYYNLIPGFNSRLDELQAAILRVKLRYLDGWNEARRQKALVYSRLLGEIAGVEPPCPAPDSDHIFNYYTIRLRNSRDRDRLREYLNSQGIATAIYYPLSLHLQEVYQSLGGKFGDFPESERAQAEVLSLPMYPELNDEPMEFIVNAVRNFYSREDIKEHQIPKKV
jgi:dTDP-4-amino-4,6-dideoxygalactose transaminase